MEHGTNTKYSYETNKPGLLCLKKMVSTGYRATEVELTQSPQPGYSHTLLSESLRSINFFCIDNTWDHALGRKTMQPNVLLWFKILFISLYLAGCYPSTNSKWGLKVSKYQLSNQKKKTEFVFISSISHISSILQSPYLNLFVSNS